MSLVHYDQLFSLCLETWGLFCHKNGLVRIVLFSEHLECSAGCWSFNEEQGFVYPLDARSKIVLVYSLGKRCPEFQVLFYFVLCQMDRKYLHLIHGKRKWRWGFILVSTMRLVCVNKPTPTSLRFNKKMFFTHTKNLKKLVFCSTFLSNRDLGIFKISFVFARLQHVTLRMIPAEEKRAWRITSSWCRLDQEKTHAAELITWSFPTAGPWGLWGSTLIFPFIFLHSLHICPC